MPRGRTEPLDASDLIEEVRRYRIYVEVSHADRGIHASGKVPATSMRLRASHPRDGPSESGCARCRCIRETLGRLASAVARRVDAGSHVEFPPAHRADLAARWDRDEVSLALRVEAARPDDTERHERAVREVRRQLEALGVYSGRWRASDPR